MVDDVKDITETAENKATEALDRARIARERRESEQRKRLDELRAHAAAAQAQREKRDDERRQRQLEQRARDDDRRQQVEERKRAIWEASISRREALLQRERERTERLERARASRSASRSAFAFGSSTPRLLEPVDSTGFFWAARRAASTTNVMFASAPLTRHTSALHLDDTENVNQDEPNRQQLQVVWPSVARRRTDLVPTLPSPRAPETRSGETTPGSRPGSAMSNATAVVRRTTNSMARKPRPASIAGTGVNTPKGGLDTGGLSVATTPSVSRDGSLAGAEVPRRTTQRRQRPVSVHVNSKPATPINPADGKPPVHRKPKPFKEHDMMQTPRGKSSVSPGRALSPSPAASKEPSVNKEIANKNITILADKNQVNLLEISQKLEALQVHNGVKQTIPQNQNLDHKVNENLENLEIKPKPNIEEKDEQQMQIEIQKPAETHKQIEKSEFKKESSQNSDESEMTASMSTPRITTEEEAKAALAERRRRAREELEKQAELERQRLLREAEEEFERQRLEEERQRRDEEEARELAQLQRTMEEEKLRKAIEAQQQLEREEAERKSREEAERQARLKEDEEKRKAAEEAERLRKEEAEREEKERLARKQRVEAIMARTRLKKAEEDKKQQENKSQPSDGTSQHSPAASCAPEPDNGNAVTTGDLLGFGASQSKEPLEPHETPQSNNSALAPVAPNTIPNNGNVSADLLGLSEQNNIEDKSTEQMAAAPNNKHIVDNSPSVNVTETNNGNGPNVMEPNINVGHISANFIQTERMSAEHNQSKMPEIVPKLIEEDFTAQNGHGAAHNHPLTLQNAI